MSHQAVSRRGEAPALARLTFDELGRGPAGIWAIHRAVAERAFRAVGPSGRAVQVTHDAIAQAVYGGLRGATSLAGRGVSRAVADAPPLSTTRRGSAVLAAVNGLIGDVLERESSPLHQPMAVRAGGEPVAPRPDELAEAFPDARPRLVVFLHGLMETEFSWSGAEREPYGARLERELGCTAVYVRYNSGRRISENGQSLDDLMEDLVAAWPVEVSEIALVGHSMGGLVARSACHQAAEDDAVWVRHVRHVISLGSPHMGAPLEQAVHWASAALHVLPETRPLSGFLRRRSGGIRDLRQGSLVDEDWSGRDPDALRAAACQEVPLLDGATHCFVTATVTTDQRHPVGRLLGDTLVLVPSGSGRSRRRRLAFKDEDGFHVSPAHHFALLNHPAVYAKLREWLA